VTRHFSVGPAWRREAVRALDGIDVQVQQGESLGIVGESGSGKSTLIRLLALLDRPTSGRITFRGSDLARMRGDELRLFRRQVQMVFQDPYSSLDPRYTVAQSIREALRTHRVCTRADEGRRIRELLERVGLSVRFAARYPRELSGGQRQRVCIARALAARPVVLLADEPVSALDVSIQAQIVELFAELKRQENLTLVIVAHDLALIREVSDRIVTLYLGTIVEDSSTAAYGEQPRHPYSYALFRAAPDPDRIGSLPTVLATGDPPSPLHPPSGCRFHTRCFNAQARCGREEPPLSAVDGSRRIACFYPVSDRQRAELARPQRPALAVMPGPTPDGA
jgi:oligopeptide/dipeptide ABC transporter ATP-binding protein